MLRFAEASLGSPVGPVRVLATDKGVAYVGFGTERPERIARWMQGRLGEAQRVETLPPLEAAIAQLGAYFQGELRSFDVPLDAQGTPFQEAVWAALRRIPHGQTRTYGDIAREVGAPGSVRAVGAANGANPIGIIVPCHRVIGADGSLTGYAGGMAVKARLLALERAQRGQTTLPL